MEKIKFENLPEAVEKLIQGQEELRNLIQGLTEYSSDDEEPMTIDEVAEFTRFKKNTIYSYVQSNKIPYNKKGNRLFFYKAEVTDWIKDSKQKSVSEINTDVDTFLSKQNKGL